MVEEEEEEEEEELARSRRADVLLGASSYDCSHDGWWHLQGLDIADSSHTLWR